MQRLLVWRGLDDWRAEVARVRLDDDALAATGTQIGVEPLAYELQYKLDTGPLFVTRSLVVSAQGDGWIRSLSLRRAEDDGKWQIDAEHEGSAPLDPPGGDAASFAEALDCDLGQCPLTNTMPVLREGLLGGGEARDFVMAWVKVPDLSVHRSEQRYEPIDEHSVRYVGKTTSFTAELELDADGLVVRYPQLGERLYPPTP
jgi:uncharacterized protein